MLQAIITYEDGREHRIEANAMNILESKLKPFTTDKNVCDISIYNVQFIKKIKGIGI
ncbi:hypothetical protein G8T76_10690 [Clostridium botulinum C/D]|uniref:hypothetical protein n=1 Tax=Clostridium botulinum TaxID=1491 RepID=UPI0002FEB5E9|nr:hypothetical protein [Clostridium botulinum]MCD3212060.1 hypothetical protein [Clostridium botulinum C/D]MCD3214875.1 hypothetical protein [Clostridium botulinum C/D]MCD3228755.1 hypothetical protein [Clostridium botulinum C/D]MCD3237580.1 hypothetical protein [Clostridium botulinum C/D]MCD3243551.1 hypothetical protein [Clostridium botulinum C/D]